MASRLHRSSSSLTDYLGNQKRSFIRHLKSTETASSSVYVCDGSAGLLPPVSDSPQVGQLMASFSNMTTVSELSGSASMTTDEMTAVGFDGTSAKFTDDHPDDNHERRLGSPGNIIPEIIGDHNYHHHHHCGDIIRAEHPETFVRTLIEVILPFVIAGFGCMFAGIVLDYVKVFIGQTVLRITAARQCKLLLWSTLFYKQTGILGTP